jgi:hypothetical protein
MRHMGNDETGERHPSEAQRISYNLTVIALVALISYLIALAFAS